MDFETVLLSPFFNLFLIICAVHGRLKCLLWYLPEVPANHGMLDDLQPMPLNTVPLHPSLRELDLAEVLGAPDDSTQKLHSEPHAEVESALDHDSTLSPLYAQVPRSIATTASDDGLSRRHNEKPTPSSTSPAQRLLLDRSDTFEIFEKPSGLSTIVVFSKEKPI